MNEPDLYIEPLASLDAAVALGVDMGPDLLLECPCGRGTPFSVALAKALKFNDVRLFEWPCVTVECLCGRPDRLRVSFGRGRGEED